MLEAASAPVPLCRQTENAQSQLLTPPGLLNCPCHPAVPHTSSAACGAFPSSTWSKETQHQNGDLENGHRIEGPFLLLQPPASRLLPRAPYPSHWSAVTRLGERPLALSPPSHWILTQPSFPAAEAPQASRLTSLCVSLSFTAGVGIQLLHLLRGMAVPEGLPHFLCCSGGQFRVEVNRSD